MQKYDWKQLEREYILSEHKSIKEFLEIKGIKYNGNAREKTKGWTLSRVTKQEQKSNKIIEKVIEKESEKEAKEIVNINSIADMLALKIIEASNELDKHLAKKISKRKIVEYDYKTKKPHQEVISEQEEITSYTSIIDRKGLNLLASALKDINDIKNTNNPKDDEEKQRAISNIQNLMVRIKEVADADTD